jgi:NAD(P)-binding Rossmann-like domain
VQLTRREILTAFLGLPFAIAACQNSPNKTLPDGEIVGANVDFGHKLRDGSLRIEIPAGGWENIGTAIVGGGVAGLTAAWKFGRENYKDFVLLELEKEVGGTARSGASPVSAYPWGAHYLPVPFAENTELLTLLDEMKLTEGRAADGAPIIAEQYLCREPEERLFYKGRWYEGLYLRVGASEEDLRQFAELQKQIDYWVNWRDAKGMRAFVVPVERCSSDAEVTALDKISFAEWMRQKGLTSERILWYCDYACRDDYGLTAAQTSAWAGMFYFCSRVRKSGAESQPFITFPEGNGRFVAHLRQASQENIRTGFGVAQIVPTENGADVICINPETNEARGFHAKNVIFASPVFMAPYFIRGFREQAGYDATAFQHNAWWVANLTLKDRPKPRYPRDFPLCWDNVFYESPSLGYVAATHQSGIDYGPTVLTYYYPMCPDDYQTARAKLFSYDFSHLADVCLSDLERAHPDIRTLTQRIDIMRWGHAMISPRTDFIWSGIRDKAQQPFRNIHFAHSDLSGVALFEEAFYHALRAAGEIMKK